MLIRHDVLAKLLRYVHVFHLSSQWIKQILCVSSFYVWNMGTLGY